MILVEDKKKCCGCAACVQVCPKSCVELEEDDEGFLYPKVDIVKCVDCKACERVCPELRESLSVIPSTIWASKNKDEKTRLNSSSGGIFALLADKIIESEGVVFGAQFDVDWNVSHKYAESKKEVVPFRGSKYVQSKIGGSYKDVEHFLKAGRKVLFTGTPCQIMGLKFYLKREYDNLFLVDFVCHGVPSPRVWQSYIGEKIGSKKKITFLHFRNKERGWKNFCVSFKYLNVDNKLECVTETFQENIYMKGFLSNLYLRPSCYECPAKPFKSGSDITVGDYWGIDNVAPEFDDDKGCGLVLINTSKGDIFWKQIKADSIQTTLTDALKGNSCLRYSVPIPPKRTLFFKEYAKGRKVIDIVNEITSPPLIVKTRKKIQRFVKRMFRN